MFLAKRGGQTVGTIYATDNRAHNEFQHENVGMFGGFECLNDQAVAHALFDRAESGCARAADRPCAARSISPPTKNAAC